MTQQLSKYLEITFADNYDKRHLIENIPRNLTYFYTNEGKEGKVVRVRELLQSEAIESTTLIQTEVYATVLEGAEPAKVMRNVLPVVPVQSNKLDWVLGEVGSYAPKVAEGAEIPIATQDYDKRTFTIEKYGVRPLITNELIEDGLFNIVNLELEKAGKKIENSLNQEALSNILENSRQSFDTSGSNQGVKAVAGAMGTLSAANFNADTVIMHPEAQTKILLDYTPGTYDTTYHQTGTVPSILGLKAFVCNVVDTSNSYTWDFDQDSEIGMLVIDSKNSGAVAMKRDITIEKYSDPIRDLTGISVTARFDCERLWPSATCRVVY